MFLVDAAMIVVQDGHALGAARAAAGVQDQRDVVGRRRQLLSGLWRAGDAHKTVGVHFQRVHRNSARRGGLARVVLPFRRAQQHLRVGVFQIKMHFVFAIAGIQRRGRSRDRCGQKADDRRQSVGQHGGHAIALLDSHRRQRVGHLGHLIAQLLIRDANSGFR